MRNIRDFTVRVVEETEGNLYGVVRMAAKQGPATWIYGISAYFLTDPEKEQLLFDRTNLFFYGNADDFQRNRIAGSQGATLKLPENPESFRDKPYVRSTAVKDRVHYNGIDLGYLLIPLEKTGLKQKQKDLAHKTAEEAERRLPDLLQDLVRVAIDFTDSNYMRGVSSALKQFPLELRDRALANGHYYRSKEIKSEPVVSPFKQRPKIWSTPTGGLPDWAREYWRRHPRK